MRKRQRNRATEEYVAKKQINAIGGGLELNDLLKIIDAKGGDYYKAELSPREGWREAYDHFGMTGKRETLDMQEEIVAEMKQYYGLNAPSSAPAAVSTPVVKPLSMTPAPAQTKRDPIQELQEAPTQVIAEELKEDYVNDILGYDVQARYEDILKPRGIIFKDMNPIEEAALFGGAALLTGAGANAAASGSDEEDFERWAREKGIVLN